MRILLIGPQGSGKSTQAKLLAEYLIVPTISTGDIFRKLMQEDTDIGRKLKDILNEGQLVDDQTTCEIIKERLRQSDCRQGFVLDGYPRTVEQMKIFDPKFDKVFYLKVADEEVIRRLQGRGRIDDSPEAIKTRLKLYYEHTVPLLDYYKDQGILIEISGEGNIEEIQDEIKKHFEKS